jgi:UDP-N-acetylglucosamine enolpyruvyl transferase
MAQYNGVDDTGCGAAQKIVETVFGNRFMHASELQQKWVRISKFDGRTATR